MFNTCIKSVTERAKGERARGWRMLGLGVGMGLFVMAGRGQEALRVSLAGAEAARARRAAASSLGYDNLKLGPTAWSFGAGLGIEANDNIRLESVDARADLIFHPRLDAHMLCRLSEINSLTLDLGAGYSAYVWHPEFSRFFLIPGSAVSLDLYIGDFWINIHDRFSITENAYQDPTVVGSADFSQLINTAGVQATWDLNKLILKLGYDHVSYLWLHGAAGSANGQPNGESDVFFTSAGYTFRSGLVAGVDLGGSLFHYSDVSPGQPYSDATEWNAGAFVDAQLTEHMHGRLSGGYTVYTPESADLSAQFSEYRGLYGRLELEHRVNQYLTSRLSGGHSVNFAFYGGTVNLYSARWQGDWHLLRDIALCTSFEYEHGSQMLLGGETFDRYGPAISVGRAITEKLDARIAYQFYWRDSDQPGRNYTANIGTVNLAYRF